MKKSNLESNSEYDAGLEIISFMIQVAEAPETHSRAWKAASMKMTFLSAPFLSGPLDIFTWWISRPSELFPMTDKVTIGFSEIVSSQATI